MADVASGSEAGRQWWEKEPNRAGGGPGGSPPRPGKTGGSSGGGGKWTLIPTLLLLGIVLLIAYGGYVWFFKRVVVPQKHVLVLLKKDGYRSLPTDQVVIPSPKSASDWSTNYSGCNGILEDVYQEGTYFGFSPFDYERDVFPIQEVPADKVGLVIRKFGNPLSPGQILAGPGQRGPLPDVLQPGVYAQYSNPYAYQVILVDPVTIEPGHRGVITVMAGPTPKRPNDYLVAPGEQGTQPVVEPEGRRFVNLFQKRVTPVSLQSQRFQMSGNDAIRFPSSDSFEIRMEGFVEWSIVPEKLPLIYVQYSEGAELIELLEARVILPYSRSFSRLVGSKYVAREFISGDTRLKFQQEFEDKLRSACAAQGIEIKQALVRDIIPPDDIRNPINEREVARQQVFTLEQQIKVARSQADLTRQMELATQNQKIGDATKQVVTITKQAERERDVAITRAQQELEVAKLKLEAAKNQAAALVARGEAEAAVILLQKRAEAEPLQRQVEAFGGGELFAQYYFYQRVAPAIRSILTNTDGPLADVFTQFVKPQAGSTTRPFRYTQGGDK
jgi:regulator of protease activity HflC (stomatin/prohibitin superfamily)